MLVIRLQRIGKKNHPAYKVIVTDKRNAAKAGVPVEQIGFVNTLTKERSINKERALHWLSVGAKASQTVWNVLVAEGIVKGDKEKIRINPVKNPEKRASQKQKKEVPVQTEEKPAEVVEETKEAA
ncbi:MAG TPA: 30S ribosomal protein S16 [Candidatus Pacearchaeota archaeon]|mgnify:CR=1 FL=1|nr:30S ribosomal protein S16 [Candidatus Pacearchaeota archaeon]